MDIQWSFDDDLLTLKVLEKKLPIMLPRLRIKMLRTLCFRKKTTPNDVTGTEKTDAEKNDLLLYSDAKKFEKKLPMM